MVEYTQEEIKELSDELFKADVLHDKAFYTEVTGQRCGVVAKKIRSPKKLYEDLKAGGLNSCIKSIKILKKIKK